MAGVSLLPFRIMASMALKAVIIHQLFNQFNRSERFNIYPSRLSDRLTVRLAQVIDMLGFASPNPRINDRPLIHGE
jgi:hypothetical protein